MKNFNNYLSLKKISHTSYSLFPIFIVVLSLFFVSTVFSQDELSLSDNGNYALQFDGINDNVFVGYNSFLDITGDITICLWYKTNSAKWGGLVSNFDFVSPDNGYEVCSSSLYEGGGFIYFECAYNDARDGFSTNNSFNDGKWHFVSAVYTPDGSSEGKVYVDGIKQSGYYWGGSKRLPSIGMTPDWALEFGVAQTSDYFEGIIDEIRIWNRVLTQEEIQANMYGHLTGSEEGLVGYWPFNEGSGNQTNDFSGNDNHGTINGATWIGAGAPIGGVILFCNPDYSYQNHNLFTSIQGAITHFLDGTSNIWLSYYDNTITADKFQVKSNTLIDVEFYIPQDAALGQWDINVETETDSIITMPVGIEILPPPSVKAQNSGTSSWLRSVYPVDSQTCWSVGNYGSIQNTVDGGVTWESQNSGTTNVLYSVCFADEMTGWVVGQFGTILQTTTGGENWTLQNSGTSSNLQSIYFLDAHTGWAVGRSGTILKTTDGGLNWHHQTSRTNSWMYSVYFTNANDGWAVGSNGAILSTSNSGETWEIQTSGTMSYLSSITFYDSETGWVVGSEGTILKTIDGGLTWSEKNSGTSNWLKSICLKNAQTGWAVGTNGEFIMTTDGGDSWTDRKSFTNKTLNSVYFVDDTTGWIVGESGTVLKLIMNEENVTAINEKYTLSFLPQKFLLFQNYPNPFNSTTTIKYSLPEPAHVSVKVFTILGELVSELVNKQQSAGTKAISWNGTNQFGQNMSSGIFICHIEADEYMKSIKMILIK